jgi:hypothetical protein
MSLIEKDLAEIHVYWTQQKVKNHVESVPIDYFLDLVGTFLKYEQAERGAVTAAAAVRDVLEGTPEFNRGHSLAVGS